jgi:hypothetical protein
VTDTPAIGLDRSARVRCVLAASRVCCTTFNGPQAILREDKHRAARPDEIAGSGPGLGCNFVARTLVGGHERPHELVHGCGFGQVDHVTAFAIKSELVLPGNLTSEPAREFGRVSHVSLNGD